VAGKRSKAYTVCKFLSSLMTSNDIGGIGFTGHRHNNVGAGAEDVGLIYMNARFYVPGIGRFASADTLVPDPMNPQQFNRYSYVLNNPLRFSDPSGHCPVGDTACWALADELYTQYGWQLVGLGSNGRWSLEELQIIWDAATAIEAWFAQFGSDDARDRMRGALGGTQFSKAGVVGNLVLPGSHHVRGSKVHLLPNFNASIVVHEIAHVLDNRFGTTPMAALLGGGKADAFAYHVGFDPHDCLWNRSRCAQNRYAAAELREDFPSNYAANGPSEDFAETFMFSVMSPGTLGPVRSEFMLEMGRSLTTSVGEFHGSPYSPLQRHGHGYVGFGGGSTRAFPVALLQ
jgi:RHS repeat-associated protein